MLRKKRANQTGSSVISGSDCSKYSAFDAYNSQVALIGILAIGAWARLICRILYVTIQIRHLQQLNGEYRKDMSRVRVGRKPRTGLRWIRMIEDEITTSGCTIGGMEQDLKKLGASNFCVQII